MFLRGWFPGKLPSRGQSQFSSKGFQPPRDSGNYAAPTALTSPVRHFQKTIDSTPFAFKSSTHSCRSVCGESSLESRVQEVNAFSGGFYHPLQDGRTCFAKCKRQALVEKNPVSYENTMRCNSRPRDWYFTKWVKVTRPKSSPFLFHYQKNLFASCFQDGVRNYSKWVEKPSNLGEELEIGEEPSSFVEGAGDGPGA